MDLNKAIESIQKQIKDYIGDKLAVVGLSGGIDSSVVAYLCVNALGKNKVLGVSMPYNVQSTEEARLVVERLGIRYLRNNIEFIVNSLKHEYNETFKRDLDKLTFGNMMARTRMMILYMYANENNGFVVGTTNKTEAAIGYYTKFGDGAVDIEPIADLYKTEIYEVAKTLGVPEQIINQAPSAGLWPDQTDEKELGISYKDLDAILIDLDNWSPDGIDENKYGKEKIQKVLDLEENSKHKKEMPPIFRVRVTIT